MLSGFVPLSPALTGPQFDVAFHATGELIVVEVKSCTATNAELQLRLGLGQVLRYRSQISAQNIDVKAVLAVELEPGAEWRALLGELDVGLLSETTLLEDVANIVSQWKLAPPSGN